MKCALEVTNEIMKLVKYSTRREYLFRQITMKSIKDNYSVLAELWDHVCGVIDMIAQIRGVAAQMTLFDFFYGLVLGELLLRYSDNFSRALQHSSVSAAEGHS